LEVLLIAVDRAFFRFGSVGVGSSSFDALCGAGSAGSCGCGLSRSR